MVSWCTPHHFALLDPCTFLMHCQHCALQSFYELFQEIWYRAFHKWGYPKMVCLQGKFPLKWMIWRYPYFRNPPYSVMRWSQNGTLAMTSANHSPINTLANRYASGRGFPSMKSPEYQGRCFQHHRVYGRIYMNPQDIVNEFLKVLHLAVRQPILWRWHAKPCDGFQLHWLAVLVRFAGDSSFGLILDHRHMSSCIQRHMQWSCCIMCLACHLIQNGCSNFSHSSTFTRYFELGVSCLASTPSKIIGYSYYMSGCMTKKIHHEAHLGSSSGPVRIGNKPRIWTRTIEQIRLQQISGCFSPCVW